MISYQPPYQYVLDSSALFDLKNQYPSAIFPTIWERFDEMCYQEHIVCPREVLSEIKKGNDELIIWAEQFPNIFLEPCEGEIEILQKVLDAYPQKEKDKYSTRPWADPLVIACAKYYKLPILQHENDTDPNQYKIPIVAKKFNVRCLRLVSFFSDQSWQF